MKRRKFLAASASGGVVLAAGCLGFGGGDGSDQELEIDSDSDVLELGESTEYGGLRVTVDTPVMFDHYAEYDCNRSRFSDNDEEVTCDPPTDPSDFVEPPTQGGHFMAIEITIRQVGQRRIQLPDLAENFDISNAGYAEDEFLAEDHWLAAQHGFPSYIFFVREYDMHEQGVFPGVGVKGYIMFEVPIEGNPDEYTAIISWNGNEDEETQAYWDIQEDAVDDLSDAEPPEHGGEYEFVDRTGGIDWGENGEPEFPEDDDDSGDGFNWESDDGDDDEDDDDGFDFGS